MRNLYSLLYITPPKNQFIHFNNFTDAAYL